MARRAKIVCTIGPATADPERLRQLVDAGMDVARLNLSHGTHPDHARAYRWIREAAAAAGRPVGILADLAGPKIRLGRLATPVTWRAGDEVVLTGETGETSDAGEAGEASGTSEASEASEAGEAGEAAVPVTYPGLAEAVRPGSRILLDDGRIVLEVTGVSAPEIRCRVRAGGDISSHKGVSVPGVSLGLPALTGKDHADLRFALSLPVDLVALSFVRSPADRSRVDELMAAARVHRPVLAKLERPEAVADLGAVVDAFDGVMVARGDLGVELALADVPLVQKRAVQMCRERAKPVIVATQMLESMVSSTRPTRAEVSDVANAVLDGTDAVMLSGETSVGRHPVAAVTTMATVVTTTEADAPRLPAELRPRPLGFDPVTTGGAIAAAAVQVAVAVGAVALVAFTRTGDTARRLARLHCALPVLAFTPDDAVRHQLCLSWGVEASYLPVVRHTDEMYRQVDEAVLALGRAAPGDRVVIVAGSPPGVAGSTNTLRVHELGTLGA